MKRFGSAAWNGCNACRPLLALFGPDGFAKRGLFVGVKRDINPGRADVWK